MEWLPLVGFVLFFALMGVLGTVVFRRLRRAQQQEVDAMTGLGFSPVQDGEFAERLAAHFHADAQDRPSVGRLMRKPDFDGATTWVCQLGWRSEEVWRATVVVESSRLQLPRFLLFPEVTAAGSAVMDLNRQLHDLMAYDGSTRDFAPVLLDGSRHRLSGPKAAWTEPIFSAEFRAWLAQTEALALSGEGNLLVVWPGWQSSVGWAPILERDLETCLERAAVCLSHLQGRG